MISRFTSTRQWKAFDGKFARSVVYDRMMSETLPARNVHEIVDVNFDIKFCYEMCFDFGDSSLTGIILRRIASCHVSCLTLNTNVFNSF